MVGKSLFLQNFRQICKLYKFSQRTLAASSRLGRCHLYSNAMLGVDSFQRESIMLFDRLDGVVDKDEVSQNLDEYMKSGQHPIQLDDVKNSIFAAETKFDIQVMEQVVRKHHEQIQLTPPDTTFSVGPLVMRLLYMRNEPDIALRLYFDESLDGCFHPSACSLILMDLLFVSARYDDVLMVWDYLLKRKLYDTKVPVNCLSLACAACFKLNSKSSYEKMKEIIAEMGRLKCTLSPRSLEFATMTALLQRDPSHALSLLGKPHFDDSSSMNNMRAIAFAQLGQLDDIIKYFQHAIAKSEQLGSRNEYIFPELLSSLDEALKENKNQPLEQKFRILIDQLDEGAQICEQTLKEHACRKIHKPRHMSSGFKTRERANVFNSDGVGM